MYACESTCSWITLFIHTQWIYKPLTEGCVQCKATLSNTLLRRAQLGRHALLEFQLQHLSHLVHSTSHTQTHPAGRQTSVWPYNHSRNDQPFGERLQNPNPLILRSWWQVTLHPNIRILSSYPHVISNLFIFFLSFFLKKTTKHQHVCFNYIHSMKVWGPKNIFLCHTGPGELSH